VALDLSDLVETLKREVNPPGRTVLSEPNDDIWLGRLMDAFWDGRLDGLFAGYVVDDEGKVVPTTTGGADMPRELGQAIVFLAAYNALYLAIMNTRTQFKAEVAGGTSYETQTSAQVLRELAQSLKERRDILLYRLSDIGIVPTYVIDAFLERQAAFEVGTGYFLGAGHAPPLNIGDTQGTSSGW
jgi:hypothetical protein